MADELLRRLDAAVGKLLDQNHQLKQECHQLRQEKVAWQQEKTELLEEVGQALKRLDGLELEDI
ncbi:hypothetical protein [Malonomonas rubra]|uniref:hypothetical protein n=1 Tax=Malonomonas rubra TaxID=57040 RepID=UPI0026F31E26|nr:hypothetical protein [Malonomonas rubra]